MYNSLNTYGACVYGAHVSSTPYSFISRKLVVPMLPLTNELKQQAQQFFRAMLTQCMS